MIVFFAILLILKSSCVFAQQLPEILVQTPRTPEADFKTTIAKEDVTAHAYRKLSDALQDQPGITVVQTHGGLAQTYIRGGHPENTLVTLDGMRVSDPTSVNGAFNFATTTINETQNTTIVKGPYTAKYGRDAMFGAINMSTRKGSGKPMLGATVETGMNQTLNQSAFTSGAAKNLNFTIAMSQNATTLPPSTPLQNRTLPRQWGGDKTTNATSVSRMGYILSDQWQIDCRQRYHRAESHYPQAFWSNPSAVDRSHLWLHKATLKGNLGFWKPSFSAGHVTQETRSLNDQAPFTSAFNTNQGQTISYHTKQSFIITPSYTAVLKAEKDQQWGRFDDHTNVPLQARIEEKSYAMGHLLTPTPALTLQAWARSHHHTTLRAQQTYRLSASYKLPSTKTEFRTAAGSGLRTPSLYQLYDRTFGNTQLRAEKSNGFEIGVTQPFGRFTAGTTYFRSNIHDYIDIVPLSSTTYAYRNIAEARLWGFENSLSYRPHADWIISVNHTFLHAKDPTRRLQLLRRPLHKITLWVEHFITEKWSVGMGTTHVSKQADRMRFDGLKRTYLKERTIARFVTNYQLNHNIAWFARVENLFDRRYEWPAGYVQPGLCALTGIKVNT